MAVQDGTVKAIRVAPDGWSAWITLEGLGRADVPVAYDLMSQTSPRLKLQVTEASGVVREVIGTAVIRKPFPLDGDLDHKIVGDDLMVHVALSHQLFTNSVIVASISQGWAILGSGSQTIASTGTENLTVQNDSSVPANDATSVGKFVTPDQQIVNDFIHVEVVAGSIFATEAGEVAAVRFVARDQHGIEVAVLVGQATLSTWGKGDAEPVYSYNARISTSGLTEGDLITVRAEIIDHIGQVHASAPNGSMPGNPAAFTDQVYLLDADGSFGKSFAYVDLSTSAGAGIVSSDPLLAAASPFKTIAAALEASQTFNQQTYGRANLDNSEIRLTAGTHTWVNGSLTAAKAVTDNVWLTVTRDPAASIDAVRLTGAIDGKNSIAFADFIKIEDVTLDRAPMNGATTAIVRGQTGDALWLHDVVFEGHDQNTVSFQVPDVWVTQADFSGTGRALTAFSTDLNVFRIRGIEADATPGGFVAGYLLVGSDLHNLSIRYPVNVNAPNANGSIIAYNALSTETTTTLFGVGSNSVVHGVAVIGNNFQGVNGPSPTVSLSGDNQKFDISNIIFHNNIVSGERTNVGYNDVFGQHNSKTLISLKWNDLYQLNTKHDVFSKDGENTGGWSVLYGVGFEDNVVHNKPAGRTGFGFAFDGLGSTVEGNLAPTPQIDIADVSSNVAPPIAASDTYLMSEDGELRIASSEGILHNDRDSNGDTLATVLASAPKNGLLSLAPDGSFRYVPNANFNGSDSFSYFVNEGEVASDPVSVTIIVQSANDRPILQNDRSAPTLAGDTIRFALGDLQNNDSDIDGDTLVISSISDAVNGTVEALDGSILFKIDDNARGLATFVYTVDDGHGGISTATVIVPIVAAINAAPSIASDTVILVPENQLEVQTVWASDADIWQDLAFSVAGGADSNAFEINAKTGELRFIGAPDYERPANANGDGLYELIVRVSDGLSSNDQLLVVKVLDANEAPDARDDIAILDEDDHTDNLISLLLANDSDVDSGDTRKVIDVTTAGTHGRVVFDSASQTLVYFADSDAQDALRANQSADDVFRYTISDAAGQTSTATVRITVRGVDNDDVYGTPGSDTLTGTSFGVLLSGGDGDDRFHVVSANDVVLELPGQGVDEVATALAAYELNANVENLRSTGTAPFTGTGNALANVISSGSGNDTLLGLGGNDVLQGGGGNDILDGGEGFDTASYREATTAVTVNLTVAGPQTTGGAGSDTLTSIENIIGSAFNDRLTGNAGVNIIEGGAGNDLLDGGLGIDTASYTSADSGVAVNLGLLTAQNTGGAGIDTLRSFENLLGSAFADTLTGNTAGNMIEGGLGNDVLDGGAGTDTVSYEHAPSTVTVNLALQGRAQNTGAAGNDTLLNFENLTGSAFDDTLAGNTGSNVLDGGAGIDMLTYAAASAGVNISLAATTMQATGGAGHDTIRNFENLTGSAFNDTLGGDGNDNILDGGAGSDTVSYSRAIAGVTVSLAMQGEVQATGGGGNDTLINFENLTGSTFDDVLAGNAGDNMIDGGLGFDTLSYAGASAGVTVSLALTTAQDTGGAGRDTVRGIEKLIGSSANDHLIGSSRADRLVGGAGADRLTGGGGADLFQFVSTSDFGTGGARDLITDFSRSEGDRIDLSGIDTIGILAGDQSFLFIDNGTFSGQGGELRYQLNSGVFSVSGDLDGDRIADFTFDVVGNGLTFLQATDFVL